MRPSGQAERYHDTPTGPDGEAQHVEEVAAEEEEEEDWIDALMTQPFSSLFQRMAKPEKRRPAASTQGAPKRAKTTPVAKSKNQKPQPQPAPTPGIPEATAKPKPRPKRKLEDGDAIPPPKPQVEEIADLSDMSEDHKILANYTKQLKDLTQLDATSSDDAGFGPWVKKRTSALGELRSGIQAKKKSLKRRKEKVHDGDSINITEELDSILEYITYFLTFLKKLQTGVTEGCSCYETIMDIQREEAREHEEVSPAIWERCLRGIAFEAG